MLSSFSQLRVSLRVTCPQVLSRMFCAHFHLVHSTSPLPHIVRYLLSFCHFTPLCCFMLTELELLLIFPSLGLPPPSIIVFASILMSMTNSKMISLQWLTPHDSFIFTIYSAHFCTPPMCKAVLQTGDAAVTPNRPVPNRMNSQFSCGTRKLTSKPETRWWHSEHRHCWSL